jgi:hypothetical protein
MASICIRLVGINGILRSLHDLHGPIGGMASDLHDLAQKVSSYSWISGIGRLTIDNWYYVGCCLSRLGL